VEELGTRVGSLADLDREGRLFTCVRGEPVLVLRMDKHVVAVTGACPHMGYSLERAVVHGRSVLECPAHRWRFDVQTGAAPRHWWTSPLNRRSGRRLRRLSVDVVDSDIFIRPRS
jgi:nitrite reductase/ring-hydroxylating ferredoxin subunit